MLERGALVSAIDHNPDMLAVARQKLAEADDTRLVLQEMAAVEIADRFSPGTFDVVAGALVFSEFGADEQRYVLAAAHRVLRPGGRLVIADEVRPERLWQRLLHRCLRWPLAVVTYLLTRTTTWALVDPVRMVEAAGFRTRSEQRTALGSLTVLVAEKPATPAEAA